MWIKQGNLNIKSSKAMTSSRTNPVIVSLLDRLTDKPIKQSIKALQISVQKNLENLLNTKKCFLTYKNEKRKLNKSLISYGLHNFTTCQYHDEALLNNFCEKLASTIQYYEPRLKEVTVKLLFNQDKKNDRVLKLRIEGLLCAESAPEVVVFNSVIEPETLSIKLQV